LETHVSAGEIVYVQINEEKFSSLEVSRVTPTLDRASAVPVEDLKGISVGDPVYAPE
jgi:hypothetical protein